MVSSATTVNSLVNSRSADGHRLPLRGRSSHPEEHDGYLLCTSLSRKFGKPVLGMTSQNESNKKRKKQSVQRWTTAAPPVAERERLQTRESFYSQPRGLQGVWVVLVRAACMYVCMYTAVQEFGLTDSFFALNSFISSFMKS